MGAFHFENPPEKQTLEQPAGQAESLQELQSPPGKEKTDDAEMAGERNRPWFIDIWLYPLNNSGVINLGIFILVVSVLGSANTIIPIFLTKTFEFAGLYGEVLVYFICMFFGTIAFGVTIFVYLYMYWYFTECIRDSAEGFLRAPEASPREVVIMDMFWQTVNVMGSAMIFFGPFILYKSFTQRTDVIFWLLLIFAVLFFPMALLAIVMRDPASGLNLPLLIRSIRETLSQYSRLVLAYVAVIISISLIWAQVCQSPFLDMLLNAATIYLAFIAAHLLGRFYWLHQDKLDWGV